MNTVFPIVCAVLILAKYAAQIWLERLNQRHVRIHAKEVPAAFRETVTPENYAKSIQYTLAKSQFEIFELTCATAIVLLALYSGVLPWFYRAFRHAAGNSAWAGAGFLFVVTMALSAANLPLDWYAQFRLEARFGFNNSTTLLWWTDRLKGLLLGLALGYPLLLLILKVVQWLGGAWWFWAWVCVTGFQLLLMVVGPAWILPLFNKLTPLPEGPLRNGLLELGHRAGFQAKDIQVMDGSKRSGHSNAFFTGFGRFRKIVLFDTLVEQLEAPELEAVLAHEIGHYKKGHVPKILAWTAGGWLLSFYAIAALSKWDWFYRGFGFEPGDIVPAFLLFGLLAGAVTFWISPLAHAFSRRHEYEADAYAAAVTRQVRWLVSALRKLSEKNLTNLTPHPYYSGFYYSHPTLLEREESLARQR
jgi:STE24 endopeptidase